MTARLIAFILDEATKATVEQHPQYAQDGVFDQDLYDRCTQPGEKSPALNNAPDGTYSLIIGSTRGAPLIKTLALRHNDTGETLAKSSFDLNIVIESELHDSEENSAVGRLNRARDLEGLLAPHISNNDIFNTELLDFLDYIAYPAMLAKAPHYDVSVLSPGESMPLTHSLRKNKLN